MGYVRPRHTRGKGHPFVGAAAITALLFSALAVGGTLASAKPVGQTTGAAANTRGSAEMTSTSLTIEAPTNGQVIWYAAASTGNPGGYLHDIAGYLREQGGAPVEGKQIDLVWANSPDFSDASEPATLTTSASGWFGTPYGRVKNGQKTYLKATVVDPAPFAGSEATITVWPGVEYLSGVTPQLTSPPFAVQSGPLTKYRTYRWDGYLKPRHQVGGHAVKLIVKKWVPGTGWVEHRVITATNYRRLSVTGYAAFFALPRGRFSVTPVAVKDSLHARTPVDRAPYDPFGPTRVLYVTVR